MAACAVVIAGCGDCGAPVTYEKGVDLQVAAQAVAGKPIEVSVGGQVGNGDKCPTRVKISYSEDPDSVKKDTVADVQARADAAVEIKPAPTRPGTPCRLNTVRRSITVPARGTKARKVHIEAFIQVEDPKVYGFRVSEMKRTVTVLPPGTSAPAGSVPAAGGGLAPPSGGPPRADFIVDRNPAIEDQDMRFDGRQSVDPGGRIVTYAWDFNSDGTFDSVNAHPDAMLVAGSSLQVAAGSTQNTTLRVTDNEGNSHSVTQHALVSAPGDTIAGGDVTVPTGPVTTGQSVQVTPSQTTPNYTEAKFEKDGDHAFDDDSNSVGDFSPFFTSFPTPGFKTVAVQYDAPATNQFMTQYRLVEVTAPARATLAAKKGKRLSVPFNVTGGKIKRRGKVKFTGGDATVNGLTVTGTGRGKVPKGTPKKLRPALKALASGRFAVRLDGSATLLGRDLLGRGSATMLVRSRKSRKTQVCLRLTQPPNAAPGKLKVLGATGRARGFTATGTPPPPLFDFDRKQTRTAVITARKGKARGLNRTCRSLARDLDGKKKKKKAKKRKR